MNIGPQELINIAITVGLGMGAWVWRKLWSDIDRLRDDFSQIALEMASHRAAAVTREELQDAMNRLEAKLDKIFEKLDRKADKP